MAAAMVTSDAEHHTATTNQAPTTTDVCMTVCLFGRKLGYLGRRAVTNHTHLWVYIKFIGLTVKRRAIPSDICKCAYMCVCMCLCECVRSAVVIKRTDQIEWTDAM